jgi:hypothetical protein
MVQPENIDSGHSNFQLDTRCGGYSRNLDYLLVYPEVAQLRELWHSKEPTTKLAWGFDMSSLMS